MTTYDLIILGAGPAGLSAAIYALRYNLSVLVIGGVPGGLMMEAHKICNWPGEQAIAGHELSSKMFAHAQTLGAQMVFDQVDSFVKSNDLWQVETSSHQNYQAKALIYALGTNHRKLGLAAEESFLGRGVSYCATCDAMFYKNKITAVVGGGNSAITAALYLSELCPTVYLISRGKELRAEATWLKDLAAKSNIKHLAETNVLDMFGEDKLEGLVLSRAYEGSERLAVDGLFIEIGLTPKTDMLVKAGGVVDEWGYIKVANDMATNLPGLFAAGDATNGSNGFRQIVTSASEGAIAANGVFNYLRSQK